jgi:hypothetical protein
MGRSGAILASLALLVPLLAAPGLSTTSTGFSGGAASVELELASPAFSASAKFPVQYPGVAWRGSLNVSTVPGKAPLGPSIDIGSDGVVDWEFNASYGAFGRQDLFSDGTANLTLPVSGESGARLQLVLPADANVSSATLRLNGTPTAPVYASGSWRNNVVPAKGTLHQDLSGIAPNATGINASVRITNGTKTVVDQGQDDAASAEYCGFAGSRRSLAQTFTVAADGELVEVQLYLSSLVGSPGSLSGEIRAVDAAGTPNSTRLSNTFFAPQASLSAGAWNPFSFQNTPVQAGKTYAVAIYAGNQGTSTENSYRFGSNSSDAYPGGSAWAYPGSGSASGAPSPLAGTDLAFRVLVKSELSAPDYTNLTVNGTALSGPDARGAYRADFSVPAYGGGSWPIDIQNANLFDIMSLNWTAETWHQNHVDAVSIRIAGAGGWTSPGKVFGAVNAELPAEALNDALAAFSESYPDRFGVRTAELSLDVLALGKGMLDVDALDITYDLTLRLPDFRYAMREFLAGKPAGTVEVPLLAKALSAGRVRLSSLVAVIDQAPVLTGPVPTDLRIPEDGANLNLADIRGWFSDDIDPVPVFSLESNSDPSKVIVGFNGTFLTARAIAPNWTGSVSAVVNATDSRGQSARTAPFDLTVTPVNDAPFITSTPPQRGELGRNFTYQVSAVDAENDTLTFSLDSAPAGMTIGAAGSVSWVPGPSQLGAHNVVINVSDGRLFSVQAFCMTVVNDNRPPAILAPSPLNDTGYAGKQYFCQFRAQDPDPNEQLVFSLDAGPAGMAVNATSGLVGWPSPVEGNFSVRVRVTDGIDLDFFSYDLRVVKNSLPAFTSKPQTKAIVGNPYTYQLYGADADAGAVVTMALAKGPEGMTLEPGGRLAWTPTKLQKGKNHVEVSVSDGIDTVSQSFDIQVSTEEQAGGDGTSMALVAVVLVVVLAAAAAGGWLFFRRKEKEPV